MAHRSVRKDLTESPSRGIIESPGERGGRGLLPASTPLFGEVHMKLKAIHVQTRKPGVYVITPMYWGKRGRTITHPAMAAKGEDLKQAVAELLTRVLT